MSTKLYLKVTGNSTGDVSGGATDGPLATRDWIKLIAVDHEVVSPRDAASGLPTGKRQHKPITVTKEIDKSSPLLMSLLCHNEVITQWELQFHDDSLTRGTFVHKYTIRLTNANVAAFKTEVLNTAYADNAVLKPREKISFTYQRIEWTWVDGGITSMDDWETPVA